MPDDALALVTRVMAKSAVAVRHDPSLVKEAAPDWIDKVTSTAKDWWKDPHVRGGVYGAGAGGLAGLASSAFAPKHRRNFARDILTGMIGGGAAGVGGVAAYKGYDRFFGPEAEKRKQLADATAAAQAQAQKRTGPAVVEAGVKGVGDVITTPIVGSAALAGTTAGVASHLGGYAGPIVDPSKTFDRGLLHRGIAAASKTDSGPISNFAKMLQRYPQARIDNILRFAQQEHHTAAMAAGPNGVGPQLHALSRRMVPQLLAAGGEAITGAAEAGKPTQALARRFFHPGDNPSSRWPRLNAFLRMGRTGTGYTAVQPGLLRAAKWGSVPAIVAMILAAKGTGGTSEAKSQHAIDLATEMQKNP